jgi:hypothetical protein
MSTFMGDKLLLVEIMIGSAAIGAAAAFSITGGELSAF